MIEVAQQLILRGEALAPAPFTAQPIGEMVAIIDALDIDPRARITIVEPHSANAARCLDTAYRKPLPPQSLHRIEATKASADDDDVHLGHRKLSLSAAHPSSIASIERG